MPVALMLLLIPAEPPAFVVQLAGGAMVAAGECLRIWAVRHIGAVSRTRRDRLGPLISSGPFGLVRNPLYIGNLLLWVGFSLVAGLVWMTPLVALLLGLEYHAIVRWEERLLVERIGDAYRDYQGRVPRWIPVRVRSAARSGPAPAFSWNATLFSERGTLIAIAAGYGLLWLKFM